MSTLMDLDGYTPEFQKLILETPPITQNLDGTYRDLSRSERIHMALGKWLQPPQTSDGRTKEERIDDMITNLMRD